MNHQDARNMLNKNQLKAVETLDGPVLTIAGPGTGKTQVLALRIVEILKSRPDISAGNILCLTYTNAGVIAMRKRLLEFVGPEAHKVQIHTYHSFCNQVIQENIEHFDIREAENISELEQYELCEKILDTLPADHLFFHKSSYHHIKDLLGLFSTIKSEGWDEQIIRESVTEYLREIPNREEFQYKKKYKEFNAGDPNPKKIATEEEKMKKLITGTELFTKYQIMMTKKGLYDFQDMILWVIKKFEQDEQILAKYQERYQYILIDEFQDTNGSQKKILDLLCSYWEDPNVFVVGDDDQSIYRFQGANMRNIMEFVEQYKNNIGIITLDQNYRSSQKVLDIAEHIIEKNTERLAAEIPSVSKHLTAHNPQWKDCPQSPTLIEYDNPYHQECGILNELKILQKNNKDLSNIAVIYQNHSQAGNLIKACQQENIPLQVKEMENILDVPLVQQILELLEYFSEETKNPLSREDILFRSLYFSVFRIPHPDIIRLTLWRRSDAKNRFFKLALTDEEVLSTVENIKEPNLLLDFGRIITQLEEDFHNLPFLRFFENFLEKSGFLHFVLKHEEKSFFLRCLSTLFRLAKEDACKKPDLSAEDFLEKIRRIQTHGLSLSIEKTHAEKKGAHFLTAHSAKGLEFERVYLIGVEKRVWDNKQKRGGFSFPDTLTLSNEGDFLEEKRRLFFVALTRAKQFLHVSYCQKNEDGKGLDPSLFVSEFAEKIPPQKKAFSEDEILDYQMLLLKGHQEKPTGFFQEEFLAPILENYSMSATHLNKYLNCPLTFYFENLLRIPSAPSPHAAFGTAIHLTLEKKFRQAEQSGVFEDDDFLESTFDSLLNKYKYAFTDTEFTKFLRHGKEVLKQYFQKYMQGQMLPNALLEYPVQSRIENVPVNGRIDKIVVSENGEAEIVDYKTGNPLSLANKKKLDPPSDKNNFLGGDYWRQIVFYELMMEADSKKKWRINGVTLDFVEPKNGEFIQKTYAVKEEDKKTVTEQVKMVHERITKMDFNGCHKEECEWCSRLRQME